MNNLANTVTDGFIQYFQEFARRAHALADQLTEEQFWVKPYSYGNSFGNLVLHLTGNLSYYIGAQIAGTGYVRVREREFTDTFPGQKELVLQKLDQAVEVVIAALKAETEETFTQEYRAVGVDEDKNRFSIYLRCSAHFFHHLGQMIYLVKELNRNDAS